MKLLGRKALVTGSSKGIGRGIALRLAQESGVTYPQLVDRGGRTRAPLRYMGLPQTVFVDEQGRMVFTERTPFRSYADVTAAIRRHLGVTP